jgi:hypothetical protein
VRGGHQVAQAVDGVPIPNTKLASNVGPQTDPKDIDYLEVQRLLCRVRRSYLWRFNVVPRTGFEKDREMELNTSLGSFHQTNDQLNLGGHTSRYAYFGSINANPSDYGLETPRPDVHDRVWGLEGFGSLMFNKDTDNQFRFVTILRRRLLSAERSGRGSGGHSRRRAGAGRSGGFHLWAQILSGLLFTLRPFVHFNRANYDGNPNYTPVGIAQHRDLTYVAQIAMNAVTTRHIARIGISGLGQHDDEFVGSHRQ